MDWQTILYRLPGIVLGLTIHEYCHAFCAYKLGDNTARDQGRLTFNPAKHIDFIGLLFIIFAGFGWAKPVQFNPGNLRKYRRDKAMIAAAGPLSNLILGILFCLIIRALIALLANNVINPGIYFFHLYIALFYAASINFGLFVFNLFPIPPLDGSHIVFSGLNLSYDTEVKIRKLGLPLLFLAIIAQNHFDIPIIPVGIVVDALLGLFL
ncbi:MAG: site-2 protease family protein [Treponema sp.]|jgi:Zn-dependent protease|nr:site-2 protease family protein [Treponema sp.]